MMMMRVDHQNKHKQLEKKLKIRLQTRNFYKELALVFSLEQLWVVE